MKIALVNHVPPHYGIGKYAFEIFSEFKRMGIEADMLYLQCARRGFKVSGKNIKVIETPFKFAGTTINLMFYFWKKLPKDYDVYHYTNPVVGILCSFTQPSIVTCYDLIPLELREHVTYDLIHYFTIRLAFKRMKRAEKIVTECQFTKRQIVRLLGVSEDRVDFTYTGLNHEMFKPRDKTETRQKLGLPLDKRLILNVGTEEPRKDIPTLIKAFYKLGKSDANCLLIRVGRVSEPVKKLIDRLGLNDRVVYTGRVSEREVAFFYNSADLCVQPSYSEGIPYPPLEAMASGCPVICATIPGSVEAVGDAGILVDSFDVDALSTKMKEVLTNAALREELMKRGLERANMFGWDLVAKRMLSVYEDVLK